MKAEAPIYLTLHEFENGSLNHSEKATSPVRQTELTKKIMGGAKLVDIAKYRIISTIGDQAASL
jgi:hypothetical protein